MKKSLFIVAAMLITLGSCSQDEATDNQSEISFSAINYKSTRSAINSTAYPTNIPFGVFAYYLPAGQTWGTEHDTSQEYMNDINVSYDTAGDIYKPSIKYYWPNTGSLTFVAYSPKKANADYDQATRTLAITGYSCESVVGGVFDNQSDLMYSNAGDAADKKTNNKDYVVNDPDPVDDMKGVQIKFRHALSQIRFYAKPKETSTTTQFNVLKVVLKNIQNKGNLNVINGDISGTVVNDIVSGWVIDGDNKKSFTPYDVTANAEQTILTGVVLPMNNATNYQRIGDENNNLLVIPQVFGTSSTCEIEVTYRMWVNVNNGDIDAGVKTKSVLVKDIISKFEPNKIYKLNFSISADEILFSPEIVSWDTNIEGSDNGELE